MTVIAVTRAGQGEVYCFASLRAADDHPVVQFGDPIIRDHTEIRKCLTLAECARIAQKIGDSRLERELTGGLTLSARSTSELMEDLWDSVVRAGCRPPDDPAAICKQVTFDRIATRRTGIHVRPRGDFEMAKKDKHESEVTEAVDPTEASAEATAEAPKEKKGSPIPKDPKYGPEMTVTMCSDANGVKYGPENNPKKPGSASFDRFAKYVDGALVKDLREAGLTPGDFDNDVKKGFISIA